MTEEDTYEFELEAVPEQSEVVYEVEELLASFVQMRPPLWDSRLPISNRSKTVRDALWLEIFVEFGEQFSIEFLQRKWRNLRDTFIKVKGEVESYTPSGSATTKRKKVWKYYETLSFLKDCTAMRKTSSSCNGALLKTRNSSCTQESVVTLPSTSAQSQGDAKPAHDPSKRKATGQKSVDDAIINMISKIPDNKPCPQQQQPLVNPICLRISEILSQMPQRERTLLEIKLLSEAFECGKDFL